MRQKSRLVVLVALIALLGMSVAPAATSQPPIITDPPYDRISFYQGVSTEYFEANKPFYIGHGWGVRKTLKATDHSFRVFIDGDLQNPSQVGQPDYYTPLPHEKGGIVYHYIFDQGLSAGTYEFEVMWLAPCGAWIPHPQDPPGTPIFHDSCGQNNQLKNVIVGADDWTMATYEITFIDNNPALAAQMAGVYEVTDPTDNNSTLHLEIYGDGGFSFDDTRDQQCVDAGAEQNSNWGSSYPGPEFWTDDGGGQVTLSALEHLVCGPDTGNDQIVDTPFRTFTYTPGGNPPTTSTVVFNEANATLVYIGPVGE